MKLPFLLAAPLALSACITVYPPDAPKGEAIAWARFGETAHVGPVRVTPLTLLEDSRCPQGVQCVWAGRVRISARLGEATRELTLGQPAGVPGGAVTLVEVAPAKRKDAAIRPADYRFGFRFAG
jgi:hypothetical protein